MRLFVKGDYPQDKSCPERIFTTKCVETSNGKAET
jgi:hypothetical protein